MSLALVGCAGAILPARQGRAQGTATSAPVASNGVNVIETNGVYPTTTNGNNHYLDGGSDYTYPSFDVLDFTVGSFSLTAPVTSVSNLTLSLTEAQDQYSKAGGFTVYLTEDTNSIATANGGSPLKYLTANAPSGLGTQLGDPNATSPTIFSIGTFTSDSSTTNTNLDTVTLTLSSAAQAFFTQQLNAGSASDLRLVIASSDANGYATFLGNTTAVPTASQPTLAFSATLNQPSLSWTPGGASNTNGGSGTWQPAGTAGDTSWNGNSWNSADLAIFGGTGGAVAIGTGGVSAIGIRFDTTGYTLGTTAGPAITLTNGGTVQVTNATDTDTVNAPVAGSVGLNKVGAGTLVLGGANTYTGTTTVSAGTLQISADTALGAAGNGIALAGGTLQSSLTSGTLTTARGITGSGGLGIAAGSTLSVSGVVNAGALTLPGGGSLVLTNTGNLGDNSSNVIGGLNFQTSGASLQAPNSANSPPYGVVDLTGGITASQASGTVSATAIFQLQSPTSTAGLTIPISVTNAGAILNITGIVTGAATIAKSGAGTLVLNSDDSGLAGTGTGTPSFRQGSVGTANGGIISIGASNPNPNNALGTGEFQANGGTVSNDTGTPVTLAIHDISLGAQNSTATPGGLVFAGNASITISGGITLYKGASTAYQHAITVNTPTAFSGIFGASATTTTSTGVTILGSSTLTLNGTAANTFTEPVTIATSGTGAGVIAAADGAFGANTSVTLNAGAQLTINTGVTTGTVNAINDAALLAFNGTSGTFGKVVLGIGTATETVGGLYLAASDGKLAAGYQPAGTYGPTGSGAQHIDSNLFSGSGLIMNLGTAVPEPSAWTTLLLTGAGGLAALGWSRRGRRA